MEENREVARLVELEWQPNDLIIFYPDFIQGTVNYCFKKIPLDKQILVSPNLDNINEIEKNINTKISSLHSEREVIDIFFVVMSWNVEGYNDLLYNVLHVLKSKILKKTRVHLFLIKGHDSYFSNKFESADKFIVASESKLGKPYLYQDFGMYVSSKYIAVLDRF